MFDVDVDKTKIIVLESPFPLDWSGGDRGWSAVECLRFQNAPDAVTVEMGQKMRDHEGEIVQGEVRAPAQGADHGAFFFCGLPRQLVRASGVIQTIVDTTFAPLANRFRADTKALGQDAGWFLRASDLGTNNRSGTGIGVNLQPGLFLS